MDLRIRGIVNASSRPSNYENLNRRISRRRESGFSTQDAQNRARKSPRKRLKVARTSASLVIDQLKSVFRCPGDLASRVRTRRNWRPEFFTKYLRCNKDCDEILRYGKTLIPEAPKICSIGLRIGARGSGGSDFSNSCDAIRNFRKRFSIVRRPTIVCKYWVAQSTSTSSLSTDVSLKAHANRRMIIDCASTEIISEYNQAQKSNRDSHSQLHERIEEKGTDVSDTSRDDRAAEAHRSSVPDFKDPSSRRQDNERDRFRATRDAQIQTSGRKSSRRRKVKRRPPRPAIEEGISRSESRTPADFRTARSCSSGERSRRDEPWLRVRVLEDKRTEYVDKFTAVNRQIEEITATLRETCYDDARVNTTNWSDAESGLAVAREGDGSAAVGGSKSYRRENAPAILRELNNEAASSPERTVVSARCPEEIPNGVFGHDPVRATKEAAYFPPSRVSWNRTRAECRFARRPAFDVNLAKGRAEPRERSVGNESLDEVRPRNDFAATRNDEHARNLAESLEASLEELRYCRIIEEKIGEVAVLEDIKSRIDRDFDGPPAEREENDTEDLLAVSRNGSNPVAGAPSATTVGESKSPEPSETEIYSSMSIGGVSENSNQNSAPSKYFSCTRIPSLISLTGNEDELGTVDRGTVTRDSSLHSCCRYDPRASPTPSDARSFSNLDASFDRSRSTLGHASPDKLLLVVGAANGPCDVISGSQEKSFAGDKIRERERDSLLGASGRDGGEWRAEKPCAADSTLETSKSSRYVGSIDSGVFSSSLIDVHPAESPYDVGRAKFKKKHHPGKLDRPSTVVDSGSDSSCTDDTLDRKVNDVVRDLTKNLILCERKARMKLRARHACYPRHVLSRACKFSRSLHFSDTRYDFLNSPGRSSGDERLFNISTPSLLSLSDSEFEDREARCQRVSC